MPPARKPPTASAPPSVPPPAPAPPAVSGEDLAAPRKLIRPSLSDVRRESGGPRTTLSRKQVPPEQTNAEAFYYLKQMQSRTPIVVRLLDGEEIRGWIEWYDKDVLKVNREGAPNLLIPKHAIKYVFKQEEERQYRKRRTRPAPEGEEPSGEGPSGS